MKKTRNETGRSMVELIGVLAVMGVLSIGSLLAYDYTRERARATGVVQSISKMLAIARVKGKEVNTFSERMEAIGQRDKMIISAKYVGTQGKAVVCSCERKEDKRNSMTLRIAQIAGETGMPSAVSYQTTPFENMMPCEDGTKCFCADGEDPSCFSLMFEDK